MNQLVSHWTGWPSIFKTIMVERRVARRLMAARRIAQPVLGPGPREGSTAGDSQPARWFAAGAFFLAASGGAPASGGALHVVFFR